MIAVDPVEGKWLQCRFDARLPHTPDQPLGRRMINIRSRAMVSLAVVGRDHGREAFLQRSR
jgi:hypothetical protein